MKKKILTGVLAAVLLLTAGILVYIGDYYHASEEAVALVEAESLGDGDVVIQEDEEGRIAFVPKTCRNGDYLLPRW